MVIAKGSDLLLYLSLGFGNLYVLILGHHTLTLLSGLKIELGGSRCLLRYIPEPSIANNRQFLEGRKISIRLSENVFATLWNYWVLWESHVFGTVHDWLQLRNVWNQNLLLNSSHLVLKRIVILEGCRVMLA